jgi:hypothetical protein
MIISLLSNVLKDTRTEAAEYVKEALEAKQRIPMIDKFEVDYKRQNNSIKKLNEIKMKLLMKQKQYKKLADYSTLLDKLMEQNLPEESGQVIILKQK